PQVGRRVLESLAADGVYRSPFATGISNGGLTAYPGGDRWRWESRLFAGRYDHSHPHERPVYGAWNRRGDPYGGAVRFGSAYLELRPEVLERTTFCFPDSAFAPTHHAGAELLPQLCALADASGLDHLAEAAEAHVHGGVQVDRAGTAPGLDPGVAGSHVGEAAAALGREVRYRPGFRLSTARLDPSYRGRHYVHRAHELAPVLTPGVIGDAARSGRYDLQALKRVWH